MSMERLTAYDCIGGVKVGDLKIGVPALTAFDRLAAYEDTGLEPIDAMAFATARKENRILVANGIRYADRLRELAQADRDGRLVVLNEEAVIGAVKKAILVNSDEKKYRYELGKDCLIPCCKDAYKYLLQRTREEADAALKGEGHARD